MNVDESTLICSSACSKCGEFLEKVSDCKYVKKDSAVWSQV
jgi:hypothetical protein